MAEPTLSTRLSRRSMLAGGAVAALPVTSPAELDNQRVDAGLLRRIAAAQNCLSAFRQAEAACFRLQQALRDCPDVPDQTPSCPEEDERWDALLEQTGIAAADLRCEYLYARYEAALARISHGS